MRKFMLCVFVICLFTRIGEAQQLITRYFPHFVAGSLPASDWESKILFVNLSGGPNVVTVEFFDNSGAPISVSTNKGVNNSFTVNLPKPASDSVSSEVLQIFRDSGLFVTGWVKAYSTEPFGADLEFKQFLPGSTQSVGKADVPPSPVENVLTYPLAPENAVALVNPGSQDANVNFTAFDRAGNKIRERSFVLGRGVHKAMFFKEDPFFLNEQGIVVIASNIPLSSIALEFEGLVFKTIPRIPTPRKLDSRRADIKVGFMYLNSNDRAPIPKEELQKYLAEAVYFQKFLLDRELPLNGFERVELPYDLEDNGLPKVVMVQGGDRERYSNIKNGWKAVDNLNEDIRDFIPKDWKFIIEIPDVWNDFDDIPGSGGGGFFAGEVHVSIQRVRYMDRKLFGNNSKCPLVPGLTLSDCANNAFGHFNHETGHGLWGLAHSAFGDDSHSDVARQMKFRSMMGRSAHNGCFNPENSGRNECALMPIEAEGIARAPLSNLYGFGWIAEDGSEPTVEILEKNFDGKRLRVVFRAEDLGSGVSSIAIYTLFTSPDTQYWRIIDHRDNLEFITIEADLKPQYAGNHQIIPIYLRVSNNQTQDKLVPLF